MSRYRSFRLRSVVLVVMSLVAFGLPFQAFTPSFAVGKDGTEITPSGPAPDPVSRDERQSVPAAAADDSVPTVEPTLTDGSAPDAKVQGLDETTAKDSATTSVYGTDGTQHVLDITNGPQNYLDKTGAWQKIDPTLVTSDTGYTNAADAVTLQFPNSLAPKTPVSFSMAQGTLTFFPEGASADAVAKADGSTVTYADALKGTDLVYTSVPSGYKEAVVLRSAPSSGQFSWDVTAQGLTLRQEPTGEITALSGDQVVVTLPRPLVMDSGDPAKGTQAAENLDYKLTELGSGTYRLDVVYDAAWLSDPARQYPVTIDPSPDLRPTSDAYVSQCYPGTNYSTDETLLVGGSSCDYRSFFHFDTPIYAGRLVYLAELDAYKFTNGGGDTNVRRPLDSWTAGNVTYNNQPSVGDIQRSTSGGANNWQAWGLSDFYQRVADGTYTDNGLRLGAANYHVYASKNYSVSTAWAHLLITYNDLPDATSLDTPPDVAVLTVESPQLKVQAMPTDHNGDDTWVQFQISDNGANWSGTNLVGQSPWLDANRWTVDQGLLKDGQQYWWRAVSGDVCGSGSNKGLCNNVDARGDTHPRATSNVRSFHVNLPHYGTDDRWAMWSQSLGNDMALKVNEATGNLYLNYPLDAIQTPIGPLALGLSYNSQLTTDFGMGPGWMVSAGPMSDATKLPTSLTKLDDDHGDGVLIAFGDGGQQHFPHIAGDNYGAVLHTPNPATGDPAWIYTSESGSRFTFDTSGKLLTAKPTSDDWAKPGFDYSFDASLHIQWVKDPLGRKVTFTWTGGQLTQIQTSWESPVRTWTLSYSSGKLSSVLDPAQETVAFSYDGSGRLSGVQDGDLVANHPSDKTQITYTTASPAQVASIKAPSATYATNFGYLPPVLPLSTIVSQASVTDPRGVATTAPPDTDYETWTDFNTSGLPIKITGPYDNSTPGVAGVTFMVWDTNGNLICSRSPAANAVSMGDATNHKCVMASGLTYADMADPLNSDYTFQTRVPWKMLTEQPSAPNADGSGRASATQYRYDETFTGLANQQYENAKLEGMPAGESISQTINSDWCAGNGPCHPPNITSATWWSIRFTGLITTSTSDRFNFRLKADDGSRLVIGRKDMVDCWSDPHSFQSNCGNGDISKWLNANEPTPITVEYYNAANNNTNGAHLELWWDQGTGDWQTVPASRFTPNFNLVTSVQDPLGTTTWSFPATNDKLKGLASQKTRGARYTQYAYDSYGRVVSETDALGHSTTTHYTDVSTPGAQYSCMDQVTDAHAAVTNYTCDGAGDVTLTQQTVRAVTGTNQSTTQVRDVTTIYDGEGRVLQVSVPYLHGGSPSLYTINQYDKAGRLTKVTDPKGYFTTYAYDELGRLTSKTLPDPDGAGGQPSPVWGYGYDDVGNQTSVTDPRTKTWSTQFDALNRVTRVIDPLTNQTTTTYSLANRTTVVQAPGGSGTISTTTTRDVLGRAVSDQLGNITPTTYSYDAVGNLTQVNKPWDVTGKPFDQRAYNQYSQVITDTRPSGSSGGLKSTQYTYDDAGRLTAVQDANANTTSYGYDEVNRLTSVTLPSPVSAQTTIVYDDAGERLKITDGASYVRQWNYDERGRLAQLQDGRGASTYVYDDDNRLTKVNLPTSTPALPAAKLIFEYDNLARRTARCGIANLGGPSDCNAGSGRVAIERYSYDKASNLTGATSDLTPSTNLDLAYDGDERLCGVVQGGGTASCSSSGAGATSYTYSGTQVTSRIDPAGTTTFAYRANDGLLATEQDPFASGPVTYGYVDGRQTTRTDPDTLVTTRVFDGVNRVTSQTTMQGSTSLASFALTYDSVGNVTQKTQTVSGGSNNGVWAYLYDEANRMKKVTDPSSAVTNYGYDGAGNRITVKIGSTTVTTTYDGAGYPISADDGTTYTTDALGELTQVVKGSTTTNYAYDPWERMTSGAGAASVYDALDRTASRTASGTTTTFSYVGTSEDPATSVTGATTTKFAYTPGGPLAQKVGGSAARYLVADLHDDVVALAQASNGNLVGRASYDPWGKVLATSGETSGLGYQGQVTDPSTGFTDMGTRYYSPDLGRFTTKDVLFGDPSDPLSLDQFIYAQDDPVTYVDPDGMRIEGGGMGCTNGCDERDEKTANYYFSRHIPWHGQDLPTNDVFGRIAALVTGAHDFNRCIHGSVAGCIWTAIMIVPVGRVARAVKVVHDVRDVSVAAKDLVELPDALRVGRNADEGVHIYEGVKDGKSAYAGITNNLERRAAQHGQRFDRLNPLTVGGTLTRGEARAAEQALIERNPGFENAINSISRSHAYYQQAVDWGEQWLKYHGY